jgi:hypothetical protein
MFLGLQLRHPEEMTEQIKPVASRQPREIRRGLGDEGRGLIRPALSTWFLGSRTSLRAFGCALWALGLGQKITSNPVYYRRIPFMRAQL